MTSPVMQSDYRVLQNELRLTFTATDNHAKSYLKKTTLGKKKEIQKSRFAQNSWALNSDLAKNVFD